MKNVGLVLLIGVLLILPLVLFADECLEGNCDNGQGQGFTEQGRIYEGEWLDGKPHGQGRLIISKDEIIEGSWQHGRLIEEKKQNQLPRQ